MAYAERMPGRNKTLAVMTVAGLHGIALYALITGLGVEYVKDAVTVLQGYNKPLAPPPLPPPPEPTPVAQATTTSTKQTTVPEQLYVAPNIFAKGEQVVVLPLDPVTSVKVDPIGPIVTPTPDEPALAPKAVRPRNDPGSWVSTSDYPSASLRLAEQGAVRFALAVGADGRVSDCRVTASSGSAELDAATCRYVARRARFEPATDATGSRVAGAYTGTIRWVIPQD